MLRHLARFACALLVAVGLTTGTAFGAGPSADGKNKNVVDPDCGDAAIAPPGVGTPVSPLFEGGDVQIMMAIGPSGWGHATAPGSPHELETCTVEGSTPIRQFAPPGQS
jgi:hypothetical protein